MDLGAEQYGAVVSVESLHHFTPEQKLGLYKKIHAALRPGGFFLEADYIACCEEEETLLRAAGFSCCEAVDSIAGATFLRGRK